MRSPTISVFVLFLVAILVLLPSVSLSGEINGSQVVETEGSAPISGGDLARARNEAVRDALQKAVAQTLSRWLSPQDSEKKSQQLNERIIDQAEGFIQDYRIVSEMSTPDLYTVTVRATIFADSVRMDLHRLGLIKHAQGNHPLTKMSLTIRGISSYRDYARCRAILKDRMSGVRDVTPREVSWGLVRFDIAAEGAVQIIAEQLREKFAADIPALDERAVDVTLQ